MKSISACLIVVVSIASCGSGISSQHKVRARVTHYCATGSGCSEKICGGNLKTATGTDATKAGGCAVDRRRIPYGSKVTIDGVTYTADDSFGKKQREKDWEAGIVHVDIRVAGKKHSEVAKMGAEWKEITIGR